MMLKELFLKNKVGLIVLHILIGYLITFSGVPKIYGAAMLIVGITILVLTSNKNDEVLLISSYFVGAEVLLRMVKGAFAYETGKYSVILMIILAFFLGPIKSKKNITYIFYLLLLLLGIIFTKVPYGESIRNAIIFNLSGPITLGICALYFYRYPLSSKQLYDLLFIALLPIISMVTYMYFRTPDLREIVFGGVANYETSGGFGPNQVATALGFGIFIIAALMLLKQKITGYFVLDALMLIYFIYRGLLTFSRGGIISGAICLFVLAILIFIYNKGSYVTILKYIFVAVVAVVGIWLYTSNITKGMLNNRYTGKNASGISKDITSGRGEIFKMQLESFYESPIIGIGVGNGKYKRALSGRNVTAASHNEISRLIEEHGLIGVIILAILFLIPILLFYKSNNYQRAFIASFFLFWFLTINHSAMRIAFPSFIYALSLIRITDDGNK